MRFLLGLLLTLFTTAALAADPPPACPRVVFLSQDVADCFDQAGATPELLAPLEAFVRKEYPAFYVRLDLAKLLRSGIAPYYIYNRRYCAPIGDALGANLFVMSRLVMVGRAPSQGDYVDFFYDVEVKAYSSVTGLERVILRHQHIAGKDFASLILGREREIWQAILAVAERQSPVTPGAGDDRDKVQSPVVTSNKPSDSSH